MAKALLERKDGKPSVDVCLLMGSMKDVQEQKQLWMKAHLAFCHEEDNVVTYTPLWPNLYTVFTGTKAKPVAVSFSRRLTLEESDSAMRGLQLYQETIPSVRPFRIHLLSARVTDFWKEEGTKHVEKSSSHVASLLKSYENHLLYNKLGAYSPFRLVSLWVPGNITGKEGREAWQKQWHGSELASRKVVRTYLCFLSGQDEMRTRTRCAE